MTRPLALVTLFAALALATSPTLPAFAATQRILCFGDSNTIADAVKADEKWPAVFQSIVKETETINASVNGRAIGQQTGAANGLESIDDALKQAGKVDEVILLLGTNDARGAPW